jgi:hypothetical protein
MSRDTEYMEHRWGTRVELDVPAELHTFEGQAAASIRNASVSGAFVETTARLPLLSRVTLSFPARAGGRLDGCVVRVEDTGVALEWLDPGSRMVPTLLSMRRNSRGDVLHTAPDRVLTVLLSSRT